MSARRKARVRTSPLVAVGDASQVPTALAIGRCIEVWAAEGVNPPSWSASRRFRDARCAWGAAAGLTDRELTKAVPSAAPWSAVFIGAERAAHLLGRGGAVLVDLPALRAQAEQLLREAINV